VSNPEIDRFVQDAYYKAEETLLWSEIGGCGAHHDCYMRNSAPYSGCDKSFDSHGWNTDHVSHSASLHEALHSMVTDYWVAIQWMEMDAEEFGHNFILTANGHGAGFWGLNHEHIIMVAMTADCKPYGEIGLEESGNSIQITF
jgi:hypothetical protein